MYWIVDNTERYDNLDCLLDLLFDPNNYSDGSDDFDDWINETYYDQRIQIGNTTIYPADAIKQCELWLYEDLRADYLNFTAENDRDNYRSEIEEMPDGTYDYYNGFKVECHREDINMDEHEETAEEIDNFNALIA